MKGIYPKIQFTKYNDEKVLINFSHIHRIQIQTPNEFKWSLENDHIHGPCQTL